MHTKIGERRRADYTYGRLCPGDISTIILLTSRLTSAQQWFLLFLTSSADWHCVTFRMASLSGTDQHYFHENPVRHVIWWGFTVCFSLCNQILHVGTWEKCFSNDVLNMEGRTTFKEPFYSLTNSRENHYYHPQDLLEAAYHFHCACISEVEEKTE